MVCNEAQEQWLQQAATGAVTDEVTRHLDSCVSCQAFVAADRQLAQTLTLDEAQEPGPGFDTRFFARLREEQAKQKHRRQGWWWLSASLVAGGAALIWTLVSGTVQKLDANDIELAMNLELIENLDVAEHLDEIEAFEVLAQIEPGDLPEVKPGDTQP
jgi:hypothetical protein